MSLDDDHSLARATAEAAARRSYGKLVAYLAARTRDVAGAEDALSDAFAAALRDWPAKGCPSNPEGWLLTVARRKLIDAVRKSSNRQAMETELTQLLNTVSSDAEIPDRRLALMFAAAHPALDPGARAPLILQAVLGLSAETIASAFLITPATMGKRLVRAKDKIRQAGIAFAIPEREHLPGRLEAVLDAVYAAFGVGWSDPSGIDRMRCELVDEAIFLARLVVELMPDEAEALGLLALILFSHARRNARRDATGEYVPFAEQNTGLWDHALIAEAEAMLARATPLVARGVTIRRYQLEAALQSAHIHRGLTGRRNWSDVVQLYDALMALSASPVVAVNRALALAEADGSQTALAALSEVEDVIGLDGYQPYWAARAELLARVGARAEAEKAYRIAIGLERDEAVRRFLQKRAATVVG